jgi:hypothetical protein
LGRVPLATLSPELRTPNSLYMTSHSRIAVLLVLALAGCSNHADGLVNTDDPFSALMLVSIERLAAPSNHRVWRQDLAVLSHAEWEGDRIKIYNVREFIYQSDDDYVVKYSDRTYDLQQLESVDFIVVPFKNTPSLAHTMLSFGFTDGEHLGVSVEARLEGGEQYSPVKGAFRQFEVMYVVADERDLIARRTRHRGNDVYLYKTVATPQQARKLFLEVMGRANKLAVEPEFYDTFTNNCTTNIVRHINQLRPGRIPLDLRVLLPGFSDRLAYDLGLLKTEGSFEETRRRARVNERANRHLESTNFSASIRR